MAWTYEIVRAKRAICELCHQPVGQGDTAYRTEHGIRPILWRHTGCDTKSLSRGEIRNARAGIQF